ncbi:glycoside hydrolase family 15 protein [Streptomyces sp. DSM 118148]|uniref:glycoside hydrolase family 15 protein n=1 Tax=Streptomyces sp. DSM 118148 TaxID=3448667 RepID=UPI00403FDA2F
METAVFTVPTDSPEADGTLSWNSTTLILVNVHCGHLTGLGYTYAPAATARFVDNVLADVVTGQPVSDVPHSNEAMQRAVRNAGAPVPGQQELDLPGYPGGFSRIGNHVRQQFQLDCFGEALLLFAAAERQGRLDTSGWQGAETAVRAVAARRREPDAGIWELDNRPWTHSRLSCVAGLRALADAAPRQPLAGTCTELADTLFDETAASSVHADGHWQRSPHDPAVDAALLLPAVRGALGAQDPRTRATLAACRKQLTE